MATLYHVHVTIANNTKYNHYMIFFLQSLEGLGALDTVERRYNERRIPKIRL